MASAEDGGWTSGSCTDGSSPFLWAQSNGETDVALTFTYWYPGEPNTNTELCLGMYQQVNHAWVDISCSYALVPVCEIDIA